MRPLMNVGRNSRTDWKRSKLYRLARRTLVASLVCLAISFFNVLVVVTSQGHLRGLVCLTACTVDVTVSFNLLYSYYYYYYFNLIINQN